MKWNEDSVRTLALACGFEASFADGLGRRLHWLIRAGGGLRAGFLSSIALAAAKAIGWSAAPAWVCAIPFAVGFAAMIVVVVAVVAAIAREERHRDDS